MSVVTAYQPIGCDSTEQTYFYMMNCLLYSRMETGFPSNDDYYDEDVNVYIANLLAETVNPRDDHADEDHLRADDASLFENVLRTENPRQRFAIYKANADYLLVSLGIFGNPRRARPNSAPHMSMRDEVYIGRGKSYYSLAQSYAVETFRRCTAVADVLGKLSRGFEKYVKILSSLRSEYFNFRHQFSDGELYHFERAVNRTERKSELQELHDLFLDLYSSYMRNKTAAVRKQLDAVVESIRSIDPSFRFEAD